VRFNAKTGKVRAGRQYLMRYVYVVRIK